MTARLVTEHKYALSSCSNSLDEQIMPPGRCHPRDLFSIRALPMLACCSLLFWQTASQLIATVGSADVGLVIAATAMEATSANDRTIRTEMTKKRLANG